MLPEYRWVVIESATIINLVNNSCPCPDGLRIVILTWKYASTAVLSGYADTVSLGIRMCWIVIIDEAHDSSPFFLQLSEGARSQLTLKGTNLSIVSGCRWINFFAAISRSVATDTRGGNEGTRD